MQPISVSVPRAINEGYVKQGLWTSDVPYQKQAPKGLLPVAASQLTRAIRAPHWDPKKVADRINRERGLLSRTKPTPMLVHTETNAFQPATAEPEKKKNKTVTFLELVKKQQRRPRTEAAGIQVTTLPAAQWPTNTPVTSRHVDLLPKTALSEPSVVERRLQSQPQAVPRAKTAVRSSKGGTQKVVRLEAPEDRHLFYANRMARNPMYTPKTHFSRKQYSYNRKSKKYIEHFYFGCKWWDLPCHAKSAAKWVNDKVIKPAAEGIKKAAEWVNNKVIQPTVNFVKNTYNNIKNAVGGCCKANESKFGLLCGIQCDKLNPPMTDFGLWCGGGGSVKAKATFGKKSRAKEREIEYGSDIDDGDDD